MTDTVYNRRVSISVTPGAEYATVIVTSSKDTDLKFTLPVLVDHLHRPRFDDLIKEAKRVTPLPECTEATNEVTKVRERSLPASPRQ